MLYKKLALIVGCSLLVPLSAMEFRSIGPKATSMGGTGVASSTGTFATHYNPALLAKSKPKTIEMSFNIGNAVQDNNFVEHVDALLGFELATMLDEIADNAPTADGTGKKPNSQATRDTLTDLQNQFRLIDTDESVVASPDASLLFQIDSWAFGLSMQASSVSNMTVNKTRLSIVTKQEGDNFATDPNDLYYAEYDQGIDSYIVHTTSDVYEQESLEYAMDNGLTYIEEAAISITEVPLSYGHAFNFDEIGELDVGATLKFMHGAYYAKILNPADRADGITDTISDDTTTSSSFGIDLGLAFSPEMLEDLTVGLVGKNLNTPRFSTNYGTLNVDPMFRMGVAYSFLEMFEVAFDYDLTRNKQEISNIEKQYIGFGGSYQQFEYFNVRIGYMQDVATNYSGSIYTAGIAAGIDEIMIDLSGQFSLDKFEYDGTSIPEYSKINLALISKW